MTAGTPEEENEQPQEKVVEAVGDLCLMFAELAGVRWCIGDVVCQYSQLVGRIGLHMLAVAIVYNRVGRSALLQ